MKTQGVQVLEGGLILKPTWAVPVQFWNRLKHAVDKAQLRDEFQAEYRAEKARLDALREDLTPCNMLCAEVEAEEAMFRRWVGRLGLHVDRWPWERGWTEEAVDAYLLEPRRAVAEARA